MKVNVHFLKVPINNDLRDSVVKKLEKIIQKHKWIICTQVFFKLENDPAGKEKVCEIQLSHVGSRISARSNETSFELAVNRTIRDLNAQFKKIKKRKESSSILNPV